MAPGWDARVSFQSKGRCLLATRNVENGFANLKGPGPISEQDFERCPRRCKPTKNDILIVRQGRGIGRAAIVTVDHPFAIANNGLLLRPLIDLYFLLNWLQSPFGQNWIRAAAGTDALAHLTASTIKRMPIPLPPPR
jgi:restriction endonuclease S subunit